MPSRSLADADPKLRDLWEQIVREYEAAHPGNHLLLTCTYRDTDEQARLYAHGRTAPGAIVTHCDGVTTRSNHNAYPSRALDFAVVIEGKVSWDSAEYAVVGHLAEGHGLIWGGDWTHFVDPPHLELRPEIR